MGCASLNQYSSSTIRFGPRNNLGLIEYDPIREASGIVASRNNANILWIHNDSGTPAVYAVNTRGKHLGIYILHGCTDGDWEDITIGAGAGADRDYIYIGAIGDNQSQRKSRSICRMQEPRVSEYQTPVTQHIYDVDVLNFRYPDGSHDAETLMADPVSGDLYIVTKRVNPAGIYRVPPVFPAEEPITVERIADLPFKYVVGGDVSPAGLEILIKTYTAIYYWRRPPGEALAQILRRPPETVPYIWEPGGEAVGWGAAAQGYYTVSEESLGIPARLYFYPRL